MAKEIEQPRQPGKRPQTARFSVSVDGQTKSSFDTREAAEAEAQRILKGFPILTVVVSDAEMDSVKVLGPTHAKDEEAEDMAAS